MGSLPELTAIDKAITQIFAFLQHSVADPAGC